MLNIYLQLAAFLYKDNCADLEATFVNTDGSEIPIQANGFVFSSAAPLARETELITFMFTTKSESPYRILNFGIRFSPNKELLLPSNQFSSDSPMIEVALSEKPSNKIIYFENEASEDLPSKETMLKSAIDTATASFSDYADFASHADTPWSIEESDCVDEWVQCSEFWRSFLSEPLQESDIKVIEDTPVNSTMSTTSPSGIPNGVDATVFTTSGAWASVNSPNHPTTGYYAITGDWVSNNKVTRLIQWEYIYNSCGSLSSNQEVSSDNATAISILRVGEYTYFASRNAVEYTGNYAYLRLENVAIATALKNDENILSRAHSSLQLDNSGITINWKEWLGLLPNNPFTVAAKLLSSIEYVEVDHANACKEYQDTYQKQMNAYGKVIRARRVSSDSKKLTREGDSLNITFSIRQPRDLPRTAGSKGIVNRYYFKVYSRNSIGIYTEIKTVQEIRETSFYVYK